MLRQCILLLVVLASMANCEKLFLLGSKYSYDFKGNRERENNYLLLKDDSTYILCSFLKVFVSESATPNTLRKGAWSVSADSLILKGNLCYNGADSCAAKVESFGYVGDSLLLGGSEKLEPSKFAKTINNMQLTEDQMKENNKDHSFRAVLITVAVLVGIVAIIQVVG